MESTLTPLNAENLYTQELVIDPEHGQIVVLRPVTVGGVRDTERSIRFFSSLNIRFRGAPQVVNFEIPAGSLSQAVEKWLETATRAGQEAIEQMESNYVKSRLQVPAAARMPVN